MVEPGFLVSVVVKRGKVERMFTLSSEEGGQFYAGPSHSQHFKPNHFY